MPRTRVECRRLEQDIQGESLAGFECDVPPDGNRGLDGYRSQIEIAIHDREADVMSANENWRRIWFCLRIRPLDR